ncbi:MAG: peptidoglycan editing factor PgeF [Ignavibacteriaceae bacterium]|nr:peptidoglycan editing factor PgeF [Ignavibacteriaceae bacterium]
MLIIESHHFNNYPEIRFGFSTMVGHSRSAPFYFNLSLSVGDDSVNVEQNRETFFRRLGLTKNSVAIQKQVHGDAITIVTQPGTQGESDAMITALPNIGLAISSADCNAIFIYDVKEKVIAAIHSGWKSTVKRITEKTVLRLKTEFNSLGKNLVVYQAPSISQMNYRVGAEVAGQFEERYLRHKGGATYLDVAAANYDMLTENGVRKENIQKSGICNYSATKLLHSYRRDGEKSGRAFGVIARIEKR